MRILKSRLVELQEEQREAELAKERGAAQDIGFGSQIRSYVLQPYQLVKDLRTGYEVGNAQGVLDGNLDGFVREYLLAKAAGRLSNHCRLEWCVHRCRTRLLCGRLPPSIPVADQNLQTDVTETTVPTAGRTAFRPTLRSPGR
jgi:hypothetical protein